MKSIYDPLLGRVRTESQKEVERIVERVMLGRGGGGSTPTSELWEYATYGTGTYIEPVDMSKNLLIGNPIHSSLSTGFPGASALFNGQTNGASDGGNYFINAAYGTGFGAFGGIFVAGHAQGTASAPAQTTAGNWLGGLLFTGYSGTTWNINGASHFVSGFWAAAATDVTGSALEADIWMGGLITRMISFETDTNAIKFNEAALDSDMTFYSDTGTPFYIDGAGTGKAVFGSTTTTSGLVSINGDLYFHKETARTIKVDDTTTAATAGAALNLVGGAGSSTTSGTGGALNLTGGAAQAGNSVGGAVVLTGGVASGAATGGALTLKGGAGFVGGSINVDVGGGFAGASLKIGLSAATPVGIGIAPTAYLHLKAGTATANVGAPIKLTTGTNLTTPEAGAMEFSSNVLHFTPSGTTRRVVLLDLLPDAQNISFGTTTGTKIGTGTTQKIGFWNATPVVQDTGWSVTGGYTADRAFDPETASALEVARVLGTLVDQLKTYGILGA